MTQPTSKSIIKPTIEQAIESMALLNNEQGLSVSGADQNNLQPSRVAILNKAELIALFTLPTSTYPSSNGCFSKQPDPKNLANEQLLIDNNTSSDSNVASQRVALYRTQHERTRLLYIAPATVRPTYLVATLKSQFAEYQQYIMAEQLDKRGLLDTAALERLWQQLHVVDDIIADIIRHMPAQQPAGWQLVVHDGHNPLYLPSVGQLKHSKPIADQGSLNSYVLSHFGVSSFTYDRGYYIGHVVGYLFSCYFFAHLSISYGVTALGESVVEDYDYASLETSHMVRLLQGLDGYCKKRIYQLAVICARLSVYATDKRIEKMLIAEVNDFDKKLQQQHLDVLLLQGLMPDSSDSTPLF
jgi:hypothetical protein